MDRRDDAALLAASADDPTAFLELYRRWSEKLMAYLYRRTMDPHVSGDLLAETFAIAYEKRHRFRGTDVGPWMFGIAKRELSRYWRRQRVETSALRRLGVEVPELDDRSIARIDELVDAAASRSALEAGLRRLGEGERRAVQLRIVEERPYAEVARALGCSEGAARVRVHRALRRLAEWIEAPL